MSNAQPAIFVEGNQHSYFLEFKLKADVSITSLKQAIKGLYTASLEHIHMVVALRPSLAQEVFELSQSDSGHDFNALGDGFLHMPSTQHDVFIWLHSAHQDQIFDQVKTITDGLEEMATVAFELEGFQYHNNRDLIGFEDGTANPKDDARMTVALYPEDSPLSGCSIGFSQQWQHNLGKFNQLAVSEQEQVVGRTKEDSIELEGDEMPDNSHVSRTDVKLDGKAMKIYRRSAPYGNSQKHGLMFLCFAAEQRAIQIQLERMAGVTEDGLSDRIMEFSKALTGSYWFIPSETLLLN